MGIVKRETRNHIQILHVDKKYTDAQFHKYKNRHVIPSQIDEIIREDTDVYTSEGKLLLRFRKKQIGAELSDQFYENTIAFARTPTNNRGSATGSKTKNVRTNPKIMTNIIGFFDGFSPKQKHLIRAQGKKLLPVRATRFVMDYPNEYQRIIPYVSRIDELYAKYVSDKYAEQKRKANQTPFRIGKTAFTTITTNVNFNTTIHTDRGDDEDGFGNLSVIERGSYLGGETCLPQYGIGVDVRTGDVLFMDVHEWHGNLPMREKSADAERLSVVCYLRKRLWQLTKGKTAKFMERHNRTVKQLRKM